jgi:hypothetical protein
LIAARVAILDCIAAFAAESCGRLEQYVFGEELVLVSSKHTKKRKRYTVTVLLQYISFF